MFMCVMQEYSRLGHGTSESKEAPTLVKALDSVTCKMVASLITVLFIISRSSTAIITLLC